MGANLIQFISVWPSQENLVQEWSSWSFFQKQWVRLNFEALPTMPLWWQIPELNAISNFFLTYFQHFLLKKILLEEWYQIKYWEENLSDLFWCFWRNIIVGNHATFNTLIGFFLITNLQPDFLALISESLRKEPLQKNVVFRVVGTGGARGATHMEPTVFSEGSKGHIWLPD